MSFWLSAIPAQNYSLNLKLSIFKKAREVKVPNGPNNAGSYDTRTHRTLSARPSGLWRR
jgi:hypothetical protein